MQRPPSLSRAPRRSACGLIARDVRSSEARLALANRASIKRPYGHQLAEAVDRRKAGPVLTKSSSFILAIADSRSD
jgi:hypothetical protein